VSRIPANHVMGNYGKRSLQMERGQTVYLYDASGREYLDFTAGIAVCNLGHAHPSVLRAMMEQAETLVHCSNLYENPQQNRLAQRLATLSGLDQVFFCNSGTEANEAAMKLARKYATGTSGPDRTEILSLPGGFHGRTFGALSITGKPKYHAGFTPLLPNCVTPATYEEVLARITEQTAACFVEVIQGEGGVTPIPAQLLLAIEDQCRRHGALLVVDEVQTGVGRTGTFFAYEQVGLQPDIVTMAKGLANGVPIGAVLARSEVAEALTPGSHGSTFGGNPLAAAVANSVLDVVTAPGFLQHVQEMGAHMEAALGHLGQGVCGRGFMWGMSVPDAVAYVEKAEQRGVLLTAVGESRVRFVPPLIVERRHVDRMVELLADC
jgi:acetylornithine/N-succinyldiaminopimelate aminotransferase